MTNSIKGEVTILIAGEEHIMRFTLGAIRELKESFAVGSEAELMEAAQEKGVEGVTVLITAGLKRGSMPDATVEKVEDMLLFTEVEQYTKAILACFNASNTGSVKIPTAPPGGDGNRDPQGAQDSTIHN